METIKRNRTFLAKHIKEKNEFLPAGKLLYIYLKVPGSENIDERNKRYATFVSKWHPGFELAYNKALNRLLDRIEEDWGDKPFEIIHQP